MKGHGVESSDVLSDMLCWIEGTDGLTDLTILCWWGTNHGWGNSYVDSSVAEVQYMEGETKKKAVTWTAYLSLLCGLRIDIKGSNAVVTDR